MLYQTDLLLAPFDTAGIHSNLSVKLHGAIMRLIPAELAKRLHAEGHHPFSVFCIPVQQGGGGYLARISALNEEALPVCRALAECRSIPVYGGNGTATVRVMSVRSAPPIESTAPEQYLTGRGCRLTFVSPAIIKTGGRFTPVTDTSLYFRSVLRKYAMFSGEAPDFPAFQAAYAAAQLTDFRLAAGSFNLSGNILRGLTGYCEFRYPQDREQSRIFRRFLAYACYSGIGAKTAQGFGAVTAEPVR